MAILLPHPAQDWLIIGVSHSTLGLKALRRSLMLLPNDQCLLETWQEVEGGAGVPLWWVVALLLSTGNPSVWVDFECARYFPHLAERRTQSSLLSQLGLPMGCRQSLAFTKGPQLYASVFSPDLLFL